MTEMSETPDHGPSNPALPPELDPRGRRPSASPRAAKPGWSRRRKVLTWVAGTLAVIVLFLAITGWTLLHHLLSSITHEQVFCSNCARPGGGVVGDLNILLVGSDSRAGLTPQQQQQLHVGHDVGQRSDTMILLHIPRGGGRAVLVSLPRDSYVEIPAHKDAQGNPVPAQMNKLNTAYSFGGAPLTVQTVEANTNVHIDHYIEINFLGFVNIVNALGGVTVCTPTPIHDPVRYDASTGGYVGSGLELPAGRSTLDGTRALEYVRAREFDPTADLGRIQRQQKFMAAMIQKAESLGVLLDLPKLYSLVGAVGKSLTTDQDFGVKQIKDLAVNLRSLSPKNVQFLRVPLKPGSFNTAAGNVVEWDPTQSKKLFHALTEDTPIGNQKQGKVPTVTFPPSQVSVTVLNATSTNGFAAKVAADLQARGFQIAKTANAPAGADPAAVVIHYGPGREDSARTLAASVPGAKLQLDPAFGSGLELIVGSSYQGVQKVRVVSPTDAGTLAAPRTAAQDICS